MEVVMYLTATTHYTGNIILGGMTSDLYRTHRLRIPKPCCAASAALVEGVAEELLHRNPANSPAVLAQVSYPVNPGPHSGQEQGVAAGDSPGPGLEDVDDVSSISGRRLARCGSLPRRLICQWLAQRADGAMLGDQESCSRHQADWGVATTAWENPERLQWDGCTRDTFGMAAPALGADLGDPAAALEGLPTAFEGA